MGWSFPNLGSIDSSSGISYDASFLHFYIKKANVPNDGERQIFVLNCSLSKISQADAMTTTKISTCLQATKNYNNLLVLHLLNSGVVGGRVLK